jgi:hypothetical protein
MFAGEQWVLGKAHLKLLRMEDCVVIRRGSKGCRALSLRLQGHCEQSF